MRLKPCGTYAAYQRHRKRGEEPCEPCRAANREYQWLWRNKPEPKRRERRRNAAREKALWRLARRYPEEFHALVMEELGASLDRMTRM